MSEQTGDPANHPDPSRSESMPVVGTEFEFAPGVLGTVHEPRSMLVRDTAAMVLDIGPPEGRYIEGVDVIATMHAYMPSELHRAPYIIEILDRWHEQQNGERMDREDRAGWIDRYVAEANELERHVIDMGVARMVDEGLNRWGIIMRDERYGDDDFDLDEELTVDMAEVRQMLDEDDS